MSEVSLAKALKIKNKQARKVADLRKRIEQYNSVAEGTPRPFDIEATYAELVAATKLLVEVKSAINQANAPIQPHIYEMAELRGLAHFFRNLTIQDGPAMNFYGGSVPTVYSAVMNAARTEEIVTDLENQADDLQDKVDAHNATVKIEIPGGA